jgi:hypothetical protein
MLGASFEQLLDERPTDSARDRHLVFSDRQHQQWG